VISVRSALRASALIRHHSEVNYGNQVRQAYEYREQVYLLTAQQRLLVPSRAHTDGIVQSAHRGKQLKLRSPKS
jgi:hypothetical protein